MADELFKKAPEAVRRYFSEKKQRPTFDWRDVAPQEHAGTFTVAKSAGYDILDDIRIGMKDAIDNQKAFEEFSAGLEPLLRKKGWWGQKNVADPKTGEKVKAQLGSLRRLRTIHWANVSTARVAGEWERTLATKRFLPFLRYTLSNAERKRPEHRGWVGTILPVDHPWWRTHYPPNGWLCRCGVRQITRRQAERNGYDETLEAPLIETRPWFNKRTGKTVHVPIGIDPGWETHPGINRGQKLMQIYSGKLEAMPREAVGTALASFWNGPQPKAWLNSPERVHMPVAVSTRAQKYFNAVGSSIAISSDTLAVKLDKHINMQLSVLTEAQGLIDQGDWRVGSKPNSVEVYVEHDGALWRIVIARAKSGLMFLRTFHQTSSRFKRGKVIGKE